MTDMERWLLGFTVQSKQDASKRSGWRIGRRPLVLIMVIALIGLLAISVFADTPSLRSAILASPHAGTLDAPVVFYQHHHFTGMSLAISQQGAIDLSEPYGYMNNEASSVRVRIGWSVKAFDGHGQTGSSRCFSSDHHDFWGDSFDDGTHLRDAISSFVVYQDSICGQVIPGPNLLMNPSFEQGVGGPDYWSSQVVTGDGVFIWDDQTAFSGQRSVRIHSNGQSIARWTQTVAVEQDSEYELSGYIKTHNVRDPDGQWWTTGARLAAYGADSWMAASTRGLRDTRDWTYVSTRFITGRTNSALISCTIGEKDPLYARPTSSGTMWCDGLSLKKVRTLERSYATGQRVALDMYTEDMPTTNLESYLSHMDEVYEEMADLIGARPYSGVIVTLESGPSMYYGLLSGNPVLIGPGPGFAEGIARHGIDFGLPHEMGHNFDFSPHERFYMGHMVFGGSEHWANIKVLYAYDQLGARHPKLTAEMWGQVVRLDQVGQRYIEEHAEPWIDARRTDYPNMHNDVYTAMNYMLRQSIGWGPFKATFREYAGLPLSAAPSTDLGKVELWANTLSKHAGVNVVPTFQAWGFPIQAYTPTPTVTPSPPTSASAVHLPLILSEQTQSVTVAITGNEMDGYEDPVFRISGDGNHNNWVGVSPNVITGWIFTELPLPPNAHIVDAHISFMGFGLGAATVEIRGFAQDNTAPFRADGLNKPSVRPTTTAYVEWPDTWPYQWQRFTTPSLAPIIQEIVNRPGWRQGNRLGFRVSNPSGTGANWAVPDYAAKADQSGATSPDDGVVLHIRYRAP